MKNFNNAKMSLSLRIKVEREEKRRRFIKKAVMAALVTAFVAAQAVILPDAIHGSLDFHEQIAQEYSCR